MVEKRKLFTELERLSVLSFAQKNVSGKMMILNIFFNDFLKGKELYQKLVILISRTNPVYYSLYSHNSGRTLNFNLIIMKVARINEFG